MSNEQTEVGVSRVAELENVLGDLIDALEAADPEYDFGEEFFDIVARANRVLDEPTSYDGDECD